MDERMTALEKRIALLEKERPGRKMKPNIVSEPGVCGINPDTDSSSCADASIYRYQQGCQGTKCVQINRDYYAQYRARQKAEREPSHVEVEQPAPASNGQSIDVHA
jgi:hypothetical protein